MWKMYIQIYICKDPYIYMNLGKKGKYGQCNRLEGGDPLPLIAYELIGYVCVFAYVFMYVYIYMYVCIQIYVCMHVRILI
jgi:hypothetical protein